MRRLGQPVEATADMKCGQSLLAIGVWRSTRSTGEGRERVIAQEPGGRMGKPEEIGAAVVWLCPDAAAFVVGHAMVIDGGQTV
jgi:NAD(P)-dependent dehydrogenase (short-subunit alcohol dehydrogenase family)